MTKAILSVGAVLASAIALAGCGGAGSGTANGTTGGVAGTHHAQGSANFRASVHGLEANLQTSVQAFQSGNLTNAIASGGPLLTNCVQTVDDKIAPHASTHKQMLVLAHLRTACADVSQAASAGVAGNAIKAKQFAHAALMQSQVAARLSR
jgi:hypothetical protein